jgi:hypothetical protein
MANIEDRLNAAGERFRATHSVERARSVVTERGQSPLRRWAIPIISAPIVLAVVLAIAFGVAALVGTHGSRAVPTKPAPLLVPAGKQFVSYHGIEILAPAGLPTTNVGCGPPQRSQIFLSNGVSVGCMPITSLTQPFGLTTISISPLFIGLSPPLNARGQVAPVGGAGATIGYSQTSSGVSGFLLVPSVDVDVDVIAPTRQQVTAILLSTRVVAVDQLGCRSQLSNLIPTSNAPAGEMLPGQPVAAYLCKYQLGFYAAVDGWLLQAQRLSRALIAKLVPVINALPLRARAGRQANGVHDVITFDYADGSTRTIDADISSGGDPPIVTDGAHTATADAALRLLLPVN